MSWEINGNLVGENGFSESEYDLFRRSLGLVHHDYKTLFGADVLARYPLFVDNATFGSGYTPITIPVLKQFVIIKLGISNGQDFSQMIYQFGHELGHHFFYCANGIDKPLADDAEEALCTAMSFCLVNKYCPSAILRFQVDCAGTRYEAGADVAKVVGFNAAVICQKMKEKCGVVL